MLFRKKAEVYAGLSQKEFARVREALSSHGIRYEVRTESRSRLDFDRNIAAIGRTGEKPGYDTVYYVTVDSKDFDAARDACRNG